MLIIHRIVLYFSLVDSFDVVRHKENDVKIVDFSPFDKMSTKGTLFTFEELQEYTNDTPEFRFIGEKMGIQPKQPTHFCIPREINEFFQLDGNVSLLNIIQRVRFSLSQLIKKCACDTWQLTLTLS